MALRFSDLAHKASAAEMALEKRAARAELERIGISQLRQARRRTQVQVAAALGVPQSQVSRIESQTDTLLSTMRNYVQALGGRLELRAVFPDAEFQIDRLSSLPSPRAGRRAAPRAATPQSKKRLKIKAA